MQTQTQLKFNEILSKVALFVDLKDVPDAIEAISKKMQKKKFSKGHLLTDQGQSGTEFFVLIAGSVSIYKKTPDGDTYKVAVLNAHSFPAFGEGGLMEGEVRSATVQCDSDVECLVMEQVAFTEFCAQYPQFALPVLKRIAKGIMARLNQTSNDLMLLHNALMNEIRSN